MTSEQKQKLIVCNPPHNPSTLSALQQATVRLEELEAKIQTIHGQVTEQATSLSQRVETIKSLDQSNNFQIDLSASENSVAQYVRLLDRILEEIGYEKKQIDGYLNLSEKTYLPVSKDDPEEFDAYINKKMKTVRKQAKKIERDLNISFSRYVFSYENQTKRLANIEAVVRYNVALAQAAEKQKAASPQVEATTEK